MSNYFLIGCVFALAGVLSGASIIFSASFVEATFYDFWPPVWLRRLATAGWGVAGLSFLSLLIAFISLLISIAVSMI